jgi:hypothetical protein
MLRHGNAASLDKLFDQLTDSNGTANKKRFPGEDSFRPHQQGLQQAACKTMPHGYLGRSGARSNVIQIDNPDVTI